MITITTRQASLIAALAVLAIVAWAVWEFQPSRQLDKVFNRFIESVESRNWKKSSEFLADNYRDQWGQDRTTAIESAREVFGHFIVLDIATPTPTHSSEKGKATISTHLKLAGNGTAIAQMVIERANALQLPTTFTWQQQSWKPWDWRLVAIAQPEIDPGML